ncbi:valine--tRNA ligase [Actibacterium sp. 188UL27-1]|uniref:valine--tRNA ligase n=1 Tax=Actibacterium sp. 188UL27-1 TaxID=2786961 RepID=UPI00195BD696|nr:valine--tRNA ligase [Actibacterium sp. 188UL27-1]MBM7068668.1 valine--tRNA ligase [Actibacterium sp. 188UL27-1]
MPMEKTFNAAEAEPRLTAAWEQAGCFKAGANKRRDETFSIMLPPPNVTGFLHAGHAFNHTLMDILTRWKRMQGYDTLWQPGLDHAGIATQLVVERQLAEQGNESRREMGRDKFLSKVWEWKAMSGGTIVEQDKRLGASMDWSRLAFTMNGAEGQPEADRAGPNFHDAVIKVFCKMYEDGLIYRGKRLVNWDPHFETAISDLEVENTEVDGHMWHFKYPLAGGETYEYVEKDEDGTVTLRETRDYISIATTRPETMLGDGAVAVHPSDERYAPIVGKLCEIPVGPKEHRRLIPIITDDYPDPDFGSGAVKITGAHDFNDYGVAQRNGIPLYALMDTKAQMRTDGLPYAEAAAKAGKITRGEIEAPKDATEINLVPEDYRGLDRYDARDKIVADINAEGLAVTVEKTITDDEGGEAQVRVPLVENKKIMQPFGDRSKVVIEPMLTDQWFVDAEKIVGPALDAVRNGETKIIPESGEKTYYHWLDNIEPWCISRQLWWGHRIPAWSGPRKEELASLGDNESRTVHTSRNPMYFVAANEHEALEKAKAYYDDETAVGFYFDGIDPDQQLIDGQSVYRFGKGGHPLYDPDKNKFYATDKWVQLTRDPDVLDTWFSSGLWPIGTLGWPGKEWEDIRRYHPTSVLITGSDILFFWVARMMMMQLAVVGEKPFHDVYLHQLVRDAKGVKMSKVLGNVVDPLEIIDEFGADALRFNNAAMASIGGVLKLSTDRIKGYRNFTTKLWNACRFAEMNGVFDAHGLCIDCASDVHAQNTLNKWIIGEVARVRETVDAALETYRFNDAANALYAFVWGKVCDWYVEFSKPILLEDHPAQEETRQTMRWVLEQCMILLHPMMPFITEELWGTLAKADKMLAISDWPTYQAIDLLDENSDREMNWVINLIEGIRSARQQMHVPAGTHIPLVATQMDNAAQAAWGNNETLIKRLARIESLSMVDTMPKGCAAVASAGATFGLPLEGIIDAGEETARLTKSLGKLEKELNGLTGRLNNPKFISSAPEDVVAENRTRQAELTEEIAKMKDAVARLAELG